MQFVHLSSNNHQFYSRFVLISVQVKRRLVEVAIVARGDVFPNFASFQEVLLKVQLPLQNRLPLWLLFNLFIIFSLAE